jgi:phage terminase large subunit GpA-like protein
MPSTDQGRVIDQLWDAAWAWPAAVTPSEWADQRRVLSRKASSEHGQWRTSRTPYLREVMDAFSVNDPTQEIVLVFASQTGKSEACNNCIGYALEVEPAPVLMVQPTLELAKRYSKMRLGPMLEATPTLAELVKPARARDSGNTLLMKEFLNDGLLIIGGANAASGLASMPIRYAIEDEVDRFPLDVDGEGSPSDLIDARTRTFGSKRKRLKTSTPTLAGQSRIWWEWERSDQRHYHVPCPHCGHKQVLTWEMMRYDPKDPALKNGLLSQPPVMICGKCGTGIEERTKAWWYGEDLGEWIPANPDSPVRGYHLPGFYSPLGWLSWPEIVIDYEKKSDDEAKLKTWVNTVLAECWAEKGEAPAWEALYRRREPYPIGVVPEGGLILTAGCDVQHNRLELEVVAWGPNMESWSVLYEVIEGRTGTIQTSETEPCPWRQLGEILNRQFPTANGGSLPITRMAVDSGDQTAVVYEWVRSQHDLRLMATKGRDQQMPIVGMPSVQDLTVRGRKVARGIKLWPLGVSTAKRELYSWLRQEQPLDPGESMPRGWCHFPEYAEGYFLGLTAEELQMRKVRGFPKYEWVKIRQRNEQLDCRVMARAALAALGADRWTPEQWKDRATTLGTRAAAKVEQKTSGEPVKVKQQPERKRKGGWLSGERRGGWLS